MAEVWTLGRWECTPGREEEFIASWRELAAWTLGTFPDAAGTLLRDREQPNVFFSFGPWKDLEQVEAWRGMRGFVERVGRIKELLEGFEPHTLDRVARSSE